MASTRVRRYRSQRNRAAQEPTLPTATAADAANEGGGEGDGDGDDDDDDGRERLEELEAEERSSTDSAQPKDCWRRLRPQEPERVDPDILPGPRPRPRYAVQEATGGNIRTAITKIVAAAATSGGSTVRTCCWLQGHGDRSQGVPRDAAEDPARGVTDAEKADLDQYYGFHHIMHWHHIMGTSAANAGGDIGVHAPLPVTKIDWHFFVKDFMAWCMSSTDWYHDDKRRRRDKNRRPTELDVLGVPKVQRFASTVSSQHQKGIPSVEAILEKSKSPQARIRATRPWAPRAC